MSDLVVSSVLAYVDRDMVTFSIGYSSQQQRGLSLFNPPQGAIVKELRELSVGAHVVNVPVRKYCVLAGERRCN